MLKVFMSYRVTRNRLFSEGTQALGPFYASGSTCTVLCLHCSNALHLYPNTQYIFTFTRNYFIQSLHVSLYLPYSASILLHLHYFYSQ